MDACKTTIQINCLTRPDTLFTFHPSPAFFYTGFLTSPRGERTASLHQLAISRRSSCLVVCLKESCKTQLFHPETCHLLPGPVLNPCRISVQLNCCTRITSSMVLVPFWMPARPQYNSTFSPGYLVHRSPITCSLICRFRDVIKGQASSKFTPISN